MLVTREAVLGTWELQKPWKKTGGWGKETFIQGLKQHKGLHCIDQMNQKCIAYLWSPNFTLGLLDSLVFFFFFGPYHIRILVLWSGIEPMPPAVEMWSLNHWTIREVPWLTSATLEQGEAHWCILWGIKVREECFTARVIAGSGVADPVQP